MAVLEKRADVLVWLEGETEPVRAGVFTWRPDTRVGYFLYDQQYLAHPKRIPLDPHNLPFKRTRYAEAKQDGMFGAFRDSGPDYWGQFVLHQKYGRELDAFDLLVRGPGDGVGAIALSTTESDKTSFQPITLDHIEEAAARIDDPDYEGNPDVMKALMPTTSVGGAKPKLTAVHDGAWWIAKFPERKDRPSITYNEHVMLEMARECGIDACESRLQRLAGGRAVLLVKRFDRHVLPCGVARSHFVSAHTVLGLGGIASDVARRSYMTFAEELRRWCGRTREAAAKRELWHRIVFNAMVGNGDDHPRNHGLLYRDGAWGLSPAFDIVAAAGHGPRALAMQYFPGGAVVAPANLAAAAPHYGVEWDEAVHYLRSVAKTVTAQWKPRLIDFNISDEELRRLESAFAVAVEVESADFRTPPPARRRRRF